MGRSGFPGNPNVGILPSKAAVSVYLEEAKSELTGFISVYLSNKIIEIFFYPIIKLESGFK